MPFTFDESSRQKLEAAKAGIPGEDAFEILVTAKRFPPRPFPKIEGVVFEPDQKYLEGLLGYLVRNGIVTFESVREEFCDLANGETILLACAGEIEKIAAIREVTRIELRDMGGHLIDEFNENKKRLLGVVDKEQKTEPTRIPALHAIFIKGLAQTVTGFRP